MNILVTHCNAATGPWCPHFTTWRDQSSLGQKRKSTSGLPNASDTRFKEISSSDEAHLRKGIIEFYTFFPWSKGNGFHVDLEQGTQEMISFLKHDWSPNFIVLISFTSVHTFLNIQTACQFPFASDNQWLRCDCVLVKVGGGREWNTGFCSLFFSWCAMILAELFWGLGF